MTNKEIKKRIFWLKKKNLLYIFSRQWKQSSKKIFRNFHSIKNGFRFRNYLLKKGFKHRKKSNIKD